MRSPRAAALAALSLALLAPSGCTNPRTEANMVQALNDAASEISNLRGDMADLQANVDSLRQVVAHQDTVIARIAEVNHIPVK